MLLLLLLVQKPQTTSASLPTSKEVALELSLSQALSLQQAHRAFVHALCYIYPTFLELQLPVSCPLLYLLKWLQNRRKSCWIVSQSELEKPLETTYDSPFAGVAKRRASPQTTQGVDGRAELSLPTPRCWLFPLHQATSQTLPFG